MSRKRGKKEMKKTLKNTILKTVTAIMAVLFVVSVTAIDSPSKLPLIVCWITEIYFLIFGIANRNTRLEL